MSFFNSEVTITKIYTVLEFEQQKQCVKTKANNRYFHALSIRLEGDATVQRQKDTPLRVQKNDLLFIPKKTAYIRNTNAHEHIIVVHFDTATPFTLPETFTPLDTSTFISLFKKLHTAWKNKAVGYSYACMSILYQILQLAMQETQSIHAHRHARLIQPAVEFMQKHFTDNSFSIPDLAKLCYMSVGYFRRIFQEAYNTSPLEYLHALRLTYATELLETNYYSIEEIAEKCGIPNQKYFSTLYKKVYGYSPSLRQRNVKKA